MPEPIHPDWHWPVFEQTLCGTMTDRERLGLPNHHRVERYASQMQSAYRRLAGLTPTALARMCEQTDVPLPDRLAAGNLLALFGDPRIATFQPAMVSIPGGGTEIGLDAEDIDLVLSRFSGLGLDRNWIAKECPRHGVRLLPYAIGRYPVTNQEYRDFLLDTRHPELPSSWTFRRYPQEFANHPVYTVSAASALAYCTWLGRQTGRAFRLPSEAEWEFAAAGSQGLEFPWGADFDADCANTAETGLFNTSPVGVFVDGNSPFGVADMAGNVEEYIADNYAAYPGGEYVRDHLVEIHGDYAVARGGSFARFRDLARTRRRHGHNPRSAAYTMGFRLAESLDFSTSA